MEEVCTLVSRTFNPFPDFDARAAASPLARLSWSGRTNAQVASLREIYVMPTRRIVVENDAVKV